MMESNQVVTQMLKQMLEFNKNAFDGTFRAMSAIGDQNEKMMSTFLDQATWIPEDGKKLIQDWAEAHRKGYVDF